MLHRALTFENVLSFVYFVFQALFLWDIIMLHGAQVVPNLCAACLLVLKGPLEGLISSQGQWAVLEKNLNSASKGVQIWQVHKAHVCVCVCV
jgi:hypothetical protein